MSTYDFDVEVQPTYVDVLNIGAGYGVLSVPIAGLLEGDVVNSCTVTISPANGIGSTISKSVDMVQRTDGFFEYVTQEEIDAHFSLAAADIATISANATYRYSVSVTVTRNGTARAREVQAGSIQARTTNAGVALIVSAISVSPSTVDGDAGDTAQLTAVATDGNGTVIAGQVFTWTSSNPTVASVDATGLVSFLIAGTATITASAQGIEDTATATCTDPNYSGATNKQVAGYLDADASWRPRSLDFTWIGGNATVAQGGTGLTSVTTGRLLVGAGSSAMTELAPGASGTVVASNGSAFVARALLTADVSDLATASTGITRVGTIVAGTWQGTAIADTYLDTLSATKLTGTVASARISGAYTGITGVGTLTSLAVSGGATVGGNAEVTGTLEVTGDTQLGDLVVTGTAVFSGVINPDGVNAITINATTLNVTDINATDLSVSGTFSFSGALVLMNDFAVGSVFTVAYATGNTVIGGTLTVNGATSAFQAMTATTGVFSGAVSATGGFTGALTGNVTGNLTGNVTGAVTGNASTATALQTARTINGVSFDGTANITVTAAAGTLTGTTLNATVVTSSLTTVGVLAAPHMTAGVVDSGGFTITAGGLTVTAGGISVAAGTTAVQALTATTGAFSGNITSGTVNGQTISSAASFTGSLAVTTNLTAASASFTSMSTSAGATIGTTLGVGGAFAGSSTGQFASTLTVTAGGIVVTGNSSITGTLTGLTGITSSGTAAFGAVTASTITTTGAVSVAESLTITSAAGIPFTQLTATTGTNAVHHRMTNTGGAYYLAIENSAGTGFGAAAYAMVLYTPAGLALQINRTTNAATFSAGVTVTTGGLTVSAGTTAVQALTATTVTASSTVSGTGFPLTGSTALASSTRSVMTDGTTTGIRLNAQAGGTAALTVDGTNVVAAITGAVTVTGSLTTTSNITAAAGAVIAWSGRSRINSQADGRLTLEDSTGATFSRLSLGPESVSFPAFRRNGSGIEIVDGANTTYTNLRALVGTFQNTVVNGALAANAASVMTLTHNGTSAGSVVVFGSNAAQQGTFIVTARSSDGSLNTNLLALDTATASLSMSVMVLGNNAQVTSTTGYLLLSGGSSHTYVRAATTNTVFIGDATANPVNIGGGGGLTTIGNGLTVSAGTTAVQAFTATTITASGTTHRLGSAGGNIGVFIGAASPSADNGGSLTFQVSNSATNWQIGSNNLTGSALTFTPSTAGGGSTFTTPALTVTSTGVSASTKFQIGAVDVVTLYAAGNNPNVPGRSTGSVANGGTYSVATTGAEQGFLLIGANDGATWGIVSVSGSGNSVIEVFDRSSNIGTSAGSAATNIYWSGTTLTLQNNSGGARIYYLLWLNAQ